ncbi:MAG: recombinase family protein [Arcobacteraceae bacterium]|nr:recombinase family protein [Arcobacteraceae bacterium]
MIHAYLRLSTTEDKQKNSFEVQLNEIKSHFDIGKTFKETVSGAAPLHKRKALLAMLEVLQKGDMVVVLRLDRISRDTVQSGWIRYEIQKKGATLVTLENRKKDNTSKLIENILLAFAQYEKETTIWRINKAFENKKSKGEALGGKWAKYGYKFYFEDGIKKIKECEIEQKVIYRIKQFKDISTQRIANILANDGVLGKSGKPIQKKQVQRILSCCDD